MKIINTFLFYVVFPEDSAPWWSEWADFVRVGVSVTHETRHHNQNPWSKAGRDGVCGPTSQEQQHPVSITNFTLLHKSVYNME